MTIDRTPAAKVKNAFKYFQDRIPSPSNIKIHKLLQLANEYAMNHSGAPITWLKEEQNKTIAHNSITEFDDSSFSDYEIDVLDIIIKRYGNCSAARLSSIKAIPEKDLLDTDYKRAVFENAYQSYLMELHI